MLTAINGYYNGSYIVMSKPYENTLKEWSRSFL